MFLHIDSIRCERTASDDSDNIYMKIDGTKTWPDGDFAQITANTELPINKVIHINEGASDTLELWRSVPGELKRHNEDVQLYEFELTYHTLVTDLNTHHSVELNAINPGVKYQIHGHSFGENYHYTIAISKA